MKVKQVIVIRKDLNMRRGKEIAQGSHASMAAIIPLIFKSPLENVDDEELMIWLNGDFTKVVLQCNSEADLIKVKMMAEEDGLTVHLIQDKGLTEFRQPTYTALAIGPHYEDKIDKITGPNGLIPLKLY
jgi:PTH2 family peptidyl-tRNA hydrolase